MYIMKEPCVSVIRRSLTDTFDEVSELKVLFLILSIFCSLSPITSTLIDPESLLNPRQYSPEPP